MIRPWWAPSERQAVTIGLFALAVLMLGQAHYQPDLWKIDTFKSVLQAIVITGLLNMVGAFHFAANKSDETKTDNTRAAFEAINATANMGRRADDPPSDALKSGDSVTITAEDAPK